MNTYCHVANHTRHWREDRKRKRGREGSSPYAVHTHTHTHSLVLYPAAWPLSHSHTHYDHCKIGFDLWPHTKMTASEDSTRPKK